MNHPVEYFAYPLTPNIPNEITLGHEPCVVRITPQRILMTNGQSSILIPNNGNIDFSLPCGTLSASLTLMKEQQAEIEALKSTITELIQQVKKLEWDIYKIELRPPNVGGIYYEQGKSDFYQRQDQPN